MAITSSNHSASASDAWPLPAPQSHARSMTRRDRRDVLEQLGGIAGAKRGVRRRDATRNDRPRCARRAHRTTATATPSCVGTMMPSTRGSVAMRRLNSRTPRVRSSASSSVHASAPQRVVADDQAARAHEPQRPLEVRRQRLLVGVEKHRVESFAVERRQHVERAADAHLDAFASARRARCSARANAACFSSISIDSSRPPGGSARAMQIAE